MKGSVRIFRVPTALNGVLSDGHRARRLDRLWIRYSDPL
jgi:hypothetical protein